MTKTPRPKQRQQRPFVFLHVGDLHLTKRTTPVRAALNTREDRLEADLRAIFADINSIYDHKGFDFVYLPGDLAENACKGEYDTLRGILEGIADVTVRLIPGDHDRAQGNMDAFADFRGKLTGKHKHKPPVQGSSIEAPLTSCPPPDHLLYNHKQEQFFYEETHGDVLCLFLDVVSAGNGQKGLGLDFRLGAGQFKWLSETVYASKTKTKPKTRCAIFMHCYPADFHEPGDAADVAGLIWDGDVRLVEMGHTHYNEIAHDGRTQYATARSVGQNEDGPVGFAVVALDGNVTSWRFKQLQQTWPFVMITSPADRRLATEALAVDSNGQITVRALILSDQDPLWNGQWPNPNSLDPCERHPGDTSVQSQTYRYRAWCSVDHGEWQPMSYIGDSMFELKVDWRPGSQTVTVNARDGRWESRMQDYIDIDSIEPAAQAANFKPPLKPAKPNRLGSGDVPVGAWPTKGIRGDQLGPNGSGRKW